MPNTTSVELSFDVSSGPMSAESPPPTPAAIAEQLDRMLASAAFRRAERSSALLRYVVDQVTNKRSEQLKEYTLGTDVFERGTNFDPRTDPIVRAEASRLRIRLEDYYRTEGQSDSLIVTLPKGGYVPQFTRRVTVDDATVPAAESQGRHLKLLWWAGVFVCGVALGFAGRSLRPPGNVVTRENTFAPRLDFVLTSDGVLASDVGTSVVLAPDGQSIVFVSIDAAGRSHLNHRRLDEAATTALAGTEGARGPFFSPDGGWIGFWADGNVKKVPVDGGSPVVLHATADLLGASWAEDGTIVAASNRTLWRIPAAPGGRAEVILDLANESGFPAWPQVLPGGDMVLYTVHAGAGAAADSSAIEVLSMRTGKREELLRGGTFGRYLANGCLTYVNQGTLYAVQFDVARRSIQGTTVLMLEGVSYSTTFGYAQVDVSKSGTLIYRQSAESAEGAPSVVEWLDRSGGTSPLITRPGRYEWLALSPHGRHLAYAVSDGGATGIAIRDLRSQEAERLPALASDYSGLLWWPTGNRLVLGGSKGMTWIDATNPKQARVLTASGHIQVPWSVSGDATRLAYAEMNKDTAFDLWTVPITATEHGLRAGTPELFLRTPYFEVYPAFSPDGRWIAYGSNENESGTPEVYVRRFPDDGTKAVRVSNNGGSVPRWSSTGREIVYRAGSRKLMVVRVSHDGGSWHVETPRLWTPRLLADTGVLPSFDLASDDRVAALMPATASREEPDPNKVTIVFNFLASMDRRVAIQPR